MLKQANPNASIVFAPKQLEKNKSLVSKTGAKRVDLVVAEVKDGKILRFNNLGNLLQVIGSKPLLQKTVLDGIVNFDAQNPGGVRLKLPVEYAALDQKASAPSRKIGVYIITANAAQDNNPRVANLISQVLTRDFSTQMQNQAIMASRIDASQAQSQGWLNLFNAKPGDVVVALITGDNVENSNTLAAPANPDQEAAFVAGFTAAMSQNIAMGNLQ